MNAFARGMAVLITTIAALTGAVAIAKDKTVPDTLRRRTRQMAGLLGAIYDHRLPNSGLVIKLPTERLYAVDGTPRETFRPRPE